MTQTTKNYSKEQEATMIAEYKMNPSRATVDVIAEELGKSVKSVIAKLVTLKVYVKAVKVSKSGKPTVSKKDLVKIINEHYGFEMPSLVKATKMDLDLMVQNLAD
jgi:ribosomal protein S24E